MIASQLYSSAVPSGDVCQGPLKVRHRVLLLASGLAECGLLVAGLEDIADVLCIKGAANALGILEARMVDLIIVDASDSGREFCVRVRAFSRYADIPVLVVAPRDPFFGGPQWLRAGADGWLEMPVSRPRLLAQVETLLVNRGRPGDRGDMPDIFREAGLYGRGADACLWEPLHEVILRQLPNTTLDVSGLARALYMSRATLYRKITEVSSMTPAALITQVRLDRAASLLVSTGHPIAEISRMVGFCTRNGLGKAFIKRFGVSPREYRKGASDKYAGHSRN